MMMAFIFLTIALMALLVVIIAPWRSIRQRATLLPSDIILPFAPALSLLFGLAFLNEAVQVGWGAVSYPAIAILAGVLLLNVRAFLLTHLAVSQEKLSVGLVFWASAAAFLLGGVVPPWYD